jgi:hypothetical protein
MRPASFSLTFFPNVESLHCMRSNDLGKADASQLASAFNLRKNWQHLTNHPAHQVPVIDGVRALAVLWAVALHLVYFQYATFPRRSWLSSTARPPVGSRMEPWASISSCD